MHIYCVECGRQLPAGTPPIGRLLADGGVILRLVRGAGGRVYDWGDLDATTAPAVPICERLILRAGSGGEAHERLSNCVGKLYQAAAGAFLHPGELVGRASRVAGWATGANRHLVDGAVVRAALPRAWEVLCSLEEAGAAPVELPPELAWVVPWWRAMIVSRARGGT